MTFVRRHTFIIVVLAAIAAAGLTDFLAEPWAQQYTNGNMDGLGLFVGPFVQSSNGIGSVLTFVSLWIACFIACAVILRSVELFMREIAHARD